MYFVCQPLIIKVGNDGFEKLVLDNIRGLGLVSTPLFYENTFSIHFFQKIFNGSVKYLIRVPVQESLRESKCSHNLANPSHHPIRSFVLEATSIETQTPHVNF